MRQILPSEKFKKLSYLVLPNSEIDNGKRICHCEKIYEEQIVRAFRKAIIERFRLSTQPIHDNVGVADIMSGRYGEKFEGFTKEADDFVPQMIKRLENIQHTDFMERDRAFYKTADCHPSDWNGKQWEKTASSGKPERCDADQTQTAGR